MLYVGHFSYVGPEPKFKAESRETGWFTLLAEAESVDDVGEQFRDLIESLKWWFTAFDSVAEVFLEDITEVRKLPSTGVLAHIHMHPEDQHSHIATALPGVPEEFCRSYGWGAEEEEEDGEGVTVEPFVSFGD